MIIGVVLDAPSHIAPPSGAIANPGGEPVTATS